MDPFNEGNGLGSSFQTNQFVLGDTYAFSPSTVGELRIAFLRFLFNFTPQSYGVDQTKFGLPESYNAQEPLRNNPDPCVAGFSDFCNQNMAVIVLDTNNSYSIMPGMTKIMGRHTFKFGAELRRMEFNFAQTTTASGFYNFDNLMTSDQSVLTRKYRLRIGFFSAGLWIERQLNPACAHGWSAVLPGLLFRGYLSDQSETHHELWGALGTAWSVD